MGKLFQEIGSTFSTRERKNILPFYYLSIDKFNFCGNRFFPFHAAPFYFVCPDRSAIVTVPCFWGAAQKCVFISWYKKTLSMIPSHTQVAAESLYIICDNFRIKGTFDIFGFIKHWNRTRLCLSSAGRLKSNSINLWPWLHITLFTGWEEDMLAVKGG